MQYPYYNEPYWAGIPDMDGYILTRKKERADIRKLANCVGGAVLLYLALQYFFSFVLAFLGFSELYLGSELFRKGLEVLLIIFSILPAFMLFGKRMQKISGEADPMSLGKPNSPLLVFLAFFAGMGACMLANYVTVFVTVLMAMFGYQISSPDVGLPTDAAGIILTFVQVSLVAALVEELSLRGCVMGNLKRYGSGFAIFASALIFGLMHGNLVQAPFALVVGLALGYFAIRTGSVWTAILIHAGNNFYSVALSYAGEFFGDSVQMVLYYGVNLFFIATGIICFVISQRRTRADREGERITSVLTNGEKIRAFLTSPVIIIVIGVMLIMTLDYIAPIEAVQ